MVMPFLFAVAEPSLVPDMVGALRKNAGETLASKTARPDPAAGVMLNGLHPEVMTKGGAAQVAGINAQHSAGFTPFGPLGVSTPSAPSPAMAPGRPAVKGRGGFFPTYEA